MCVCVYVYIYREREYVNVYIVDTIFTLILCSKYTGNRLYYRNCKQCHSHAEACEACEVGEVRPLLVPCRLSSPTYIECVLYICVH